MTTIDIFLIIAIGASLVYGLYKGLIYQIASLGGVILGVVACRLFATQFGETLMGWFPGAISTATVATVIAAIVIYLVVYFSVGIIASVAHRMSHALMVGWLDHLLGGVLGVLKWMLLLSILLNIWHMISPQSQVFTSSTLMDGQLFDFVMRFAPMVFGVITDQVHDATANLV